MKEKEESLGKAACWHVIVIPHAVQNNFKATCFTFLRNEIKMQDNSLGKVGEIFNMGLNECEAHVHKEGIILNHVKLRKITHVTYVC